MNSAQPFKSHSMSECDSSDHPVCIGVLNFNFNFFDFSQTAAQICFKLCVDVPLVDINQAC